MWLLLPRVSVYPHQTWCTQMSLSLAARLQGFYLWLRGRASVLLPEDCWFYSPGLHVEVSFIKILNPKPALDVLVSSLHGSNRMYVSITVSHFGQKHLLNVNLWASWITANEPSLYVSRFKTSPHLM